MVVGWGNIKMSKWAIEEKEELGHHNVSETYLPPFPFSCQRDMNLVVCPFHIGGGGGGAAAAAKFTPKWGRESPYKIEGFFDQTS